MFRLFGFTIILAFCLSSIASAQTFAVYSGFGRSSFDENLIGQVIQASGVNVDLSENIELEQSSFVPIGAQFILSLPIISIGAEVNYTIVPYEFDITAKNITIGQTKLESFKLSETTLKQLMFSIFLKLKLLPGPIVPYARAGAGLYSGDFESDFTDEAESLAQILNVDLPEKVIVKNAVGVNIGGGVEIGGFFAEIIYHFVPREPEITGSESFQMNNYGIQIGYQFKLL